MYGSQMSLTYVVELDHISIEPEQFNRFHLKIFSDTRGDRIHFLCLIL